jgi:hypothetical protein
METTILHLFYFALLNLAVVIFGYLILKKRLVLLSWLLLIISLLIIHFIFLNEHPVIRMLALIVITFTCMKVIAAANDYKNKPLGLTFVQWSAFAIGWMGMRAQPFEKLGGAPLPNAWSMIRFGISRVIGGLVLILVAHQVVLLHLAPTLSYIIITALLLIGLSLILHFGLLSISAGTWRLSGVNTYYLFKSPAKATSLTEFWSKRWNIAFSEMTSIAIFRPLVNKTGAAAALILAFAFSGLLHEIALSVPVNSGYGLPTLYFIIQSGLVLFEKVMTSRRISFLSNKIIARVWTLFWVIVPMPLLFHTQFIKQVVWPLAGMHY